VMDDLLDKFKGSMLASALGDALGASNLRVGRILRYTDDTAMMIALAEEIVEDNGIIDPSNLLRKFIEAYEREPWRGYGPGPPRIFRMVRRGLGPFGLDRRFYPGGSYGNGAAMRITPVGLLYDDPKILREMVENASKPTHSHPLGIEGAYIQARSISIAVKSSKLDDVDPRDFIEILVAETSVEIYREKLGKVLKLLRMKPDKIEVVKELGNGVESFNSVPTAIYSYLRFQDPMESIRFAVSLGGDRDTIGCMAGAIAGAHRGLAKIPVNLLNRLENAELIEELAERLHELKTGIKHIKGI